MAGTGDQSHSDAIFNANTPFFDSLMAQYPNAALQTSGEAGAQGLPERANGGSEVGHLNIGAGRIVYQVLTRINNSIRDGELRRKSGARRLPSKKPKNPEESSTSWSNT